jgi:hypothetical protein
MAEQNAAAAAVELSRKLQKQIEDLRKPFRAFAVEFGKVYQKRKDLAPVFMAAYVAWQTEVGAQPFIRFVQVLDPDVPSDRNGYRAHASYQAADYMRRSIGRRDAGGNAAKPTRSPGLVNLARLLKTVLPLYKDAELFWRGIAAELTLRPRQVTNLRAAVDEVEPLIELPKIKPQAGPAKIIHMPTRAEQVEQAQAQTSGMASGTARRTPRRKRAA